MCSVVIDDFDIERVTVAPDKTNPKLIVDANAVLASPVAAQRFEPVTRWNPQIVQPRGAVQDGEFAHGYAFDCNPMTYASTFEQCTGLGIAKRTDHPVTMVTFRVSTVKR